MAQKFISLDGNVRVLDQSYRIPAVVHDLSFDIIRSVARRREKIFKPAGHQGSINYHNDIEEQWTLQSGLLDVYETQQVRDIVKSPQVLAYIQGQWLPVLVDTKNYSFQVEKISKATFAEIKITIA